MTEFIDISLPLSSRLPFWPGSSGFALSWKKQLTQGDECNNSQITSDVHVGTHIDAPYHFFTEGGTIDAVSLNTLIGPCSVLQFKGIDKITSGDLDNASITEPKERLLLKTENSKFWKVEDSSFREDFVALEPDAAEWIVDHRIKLIGIDYLSIGRLHSGLETHQILLSAGIAVVEGLLLRDVSPGPYELICLPLKIEGAEGAPARVVLKKSGDFDSKICSKE
jgi:arylformamidase